MTDFIRQTLTCIAAASFLHEMPLWVVMWGIAFAIYAGCKALTWVTHRRPSDPAWRTAAYLLAWPGMDAARFLRPAVHPIPRPSPAEWAFAFAKFLGGLALFLVAERLSPQQPSLLIGWLGMVGIIFTLHFGLFQVLSCWWRRCGIEAAPLMHWPILSSSLTEFWGRRWNRAFRDLSHEFVFRPVSKQTGSAAWALLITFAVSGIVHDVVISLPARGGAGGPTAYFLLQAFGITSERSRFGRWLGLGHGWVGRVFALAILCGPLLWLFHGSFVRNIIIPFLQAGRIP